MNTASSVLDTNCHNEAEHDSQREGHVLDLAVVCAHSWLLYEGKVQEEGIEYL